MSHCGRKWDDHVIRLNCEAFGKRHPTASPWYCCRWWFSVSIYRVMFSSPLCYSVTHCVVSFCFLPSRLLSLYLYYLSPSLFPLPPFFSPPPTWLPSPHRCHWQEVIPSLCCWKMEIEDKLSLIMCPLGLMSIWVGQRERGEMAYVHVRILNLTAKFKPWYTSLLQLQYSHFYM